MQLTRNVFTIADLTKWMEEETLIINKVYQREQGLWQLNSRSYLIDTILNGYPFPKITIRQTIDLRTRKSIREIVDGQQRMTTINDFVNDRLVLSLVSKSYRGKKFSDLDEEPREKFLAYEVSVDTAIGAVEDEVIEIFRRMNSYTLPLNEPEKRHASYQGEFKWFIKEILDAYTPMLEGYKILTLRAISRMEDADLITELCQILMEGITNRSKNKLEKLYKENDKQFENKNIVKARLTETLDFIKTKLNKLCSSGVLKSYSLYSLFSALIYNKWGISNIQSTDVNNLTVIGEYTGDVDMAIENISRLFTAVDQGDTTGRFGEFVDASTATTHSLKNRKIRLKWLAAALQDRL